MSDGLKIPFNFALNRFAKKNAFDLTQMLGQALPCHVVARNGAIVTIAFDVQPPEGITLPQTKCPILESQYVKLPIQVGDRGITIPCSANLNPTTGLGGKAAPFQSQPFNLSSLVFVPVGNLGWSNPDGTATIITSQNGSSVVTVSNSGITMTKGGSSISIDGSSISINASTVTINGTTTVNGAATVTGASTLSGGATISGKSFLSHTHGGVSTGTGTTGGVS